MASLTYLIPLVAIALGWAVLGETPPPLAAAGGVLCLAGVVLVRRRRRLVSRQMVREGQVVALDVDVLADSPDVGG